MWRKRVWVGLVGWHTGREHQRADDPDHRAGGQLPADIREGPIAALGAKAGKQPRIVGELGNLLAQLAPGVEGERRPESRLEIASRSDGTGQETVFP